MKKLTLLTAVIATFAFGACATTKHECPKSKCASAEKKCCKDKGTDKCCSKKKH